MAIPTILKGETSKPITLLLVEGYDYAGCVLLVGFCGLCRTFDDLVAGGSVELRFSAEETAIFPFGTSKVYLALRNGNGEVRRLPWAKIKVTDSPADLYDAQITIDPASLNVDDLTTGDSLGAVKTKLQAVINFLRGLKVFAVCAIPFFALADVEPQYATMNDIPGDAPIMTNTAECISAAVTNLDARPVPITPQTSGRGVTFVDQYGEDQNVAVAIGDGAHAAVTTNAVEAAADNKVIRSTGVAIGGHASVENSADPLKIQGVAVGWHATVSAINGVAVGGGANHPGDDNATTASAPKAIAIGYNAKASAANAVQLGEGVNAEEDTLKFRNVTIVKDGKIQSSIDEDQLLVDGFTKMDFSESNSVKRITIRNDEHTFRVVTDTNRADGVALTMGDAEIYGTAAIDRKIAEATPADYAAVSSAALRSAPLIKGSTEPTGTPNDVWVCDIDNTVMEFVRMSYEPGGLVYVWEGTNRNNRIWGTGATSFRRFDAVVYQLTYRPDQNSCTWSVRDVATGREGWWPVTIDGDYDLVNLDYTSLVTNNCITMQCEVPQFDIHIGPYHCRRFGVANLSEVVYTDVLGGSISNTVTKAYVESLGITSEESDPTVPAWAKAAQKPSYTADEVGAVSSNKIEEVRTDNAQTRQIVTTWENFLDGSNVVFSITNYLSGSYNLDAAKLRILELRDGEYHEVYNSRDEILLHIDDFSNRCFRVALDAIVDEVAARLASKADRDWGKYTSAGGDAPSNTVYMTAPNTVFAGGLEYERVAVGEGSICVLTTKGAPTWTQGDEGTFKFQDDGGTNYFGFAKTDSYTIGAKTDGITVQGGMVTMQYNITMSGRPCVWYKSTLSPSAEWEQLNLPDGSPVSGATYAVSWEQNPTPGTQVCYLNVGNSPQGFFRATVEVAGEAKFMTNMPADLSGGIISTNTATGVNGVVKPTFNGSSVIWNWSAK